MAKRKNNGKNVGRNVGKNNLPGSIYLNKNRYWWKVQLPGEPTLKARPLKPIGARFATGDYSIAIEVAKNLYEAAVFNSGRSGDMINDEHTDSLGSVARAYVEYADEYYRQANGHCSSEPANIRYSLKALIEMFLLPR